MSELSTLTAGGAPWAMAADDVDAVLARINGIGSLKALLSKLPTKADSGQRLANEKGVGVMFVRGPLFKSENLITRVLGFTTYETLMQDFRAALDDPAIKSIVLEIDSAGGEASGCDELATAIYQARGRKPIRAYVSGMGCSAAYWIASAAEKVTVSESAVLGSIGVVLGTVDRSAADEKRGVTRREFVSSNAPGKRANPGTETGRASLQKLVDDLGNVFVTQVARHRGVSVETVTKGFGQGSVEIGAKAVRAGMADNVGSFDGLLSGLRGSRSTVPTKVGATAAVPTAAAALQASHRTALPAKPAKPTAEQIAASWKSVVDAVNDHVGPTGIKGGI